MLFPCDQTTIYFCSFKFFSYSIVKTRPLRIATKMAQNPSENSKRELSAEEVLTRPAEEFVNDAQVESAWLSTAVRHMETYYKLLTSVASPADLKLSSDDELIYKAFKEEFPDLNVENLTEESIKSDEAKIKWRKFCMDHEKNVKDFNFATLLRLNSHQDYNEANTIVVPRVQFIAIEIARNVQGLNKNLPPFIE